MQGKNPMVSIIIPSRALQSEEVGGIRQALDLGLDEIVYFAYYER
jgi:hypothetical protein